VENYTLTTARAARLLGVALIIWGVSDIVTREVYLHIQEAHFAASFGKDHPLAQGDSFFVVAPGLVAPISAFITGLLLMMFSRTIQGLLR
jgi:hypothetical protein